MRIGYTLSSEEHGPTALVERAQRAEEVGFEFVGISDHFHPWTDRQGHSPFVWTVLGGIAATTDRLLVGTGVTCPTVRMHPVVVAQAAATTAAMLPGRFLFGVGTGENLNEHITGAHWPPTATRQAMLAEAIEVIRKLWAGGYVNHSGEHYTVENARLYTLPDEPPPIVVAASGPKAAELAGELGDGLWSVAPDAEIVERFTAAGGDGPRLAQLHVCWAATEEEGVQTAHEIWPNAGLSGALSQELPLPLHFEQAAETVRPEDVAKSVTCGPDPERHLEAIRRYADAGFDHIYVHQIGPDQDGFFRFYEREVLPKL